MKKEIKSCYNCKYYPLCRVMTKINRIISDESIFNDEFIIKRALAKTCKYYKLEGGA